MLNRIIFLIFYKLYRMFDELALKCYEIYWNSLNKDNK